MLTCIRALSFDYCCSSWCWRHFCGSSVLVSHGSFSTLMTRCLLWTPRRSLSPSWRCGRLAWKVKGSKSTRRRPSSGSPMLAFIRWRLVPYFLDTGFSIFLSIQVSISSKLRIVWIFTDMYNAWACCWSKPIAHFGCFCSNPATCTWQQINSKTVFFCVFFLLFCFLT